MHLEKGEEMYQNVSGWLLQKLNPQSLSMQLFVIRQVSFVICSKALYFFYAQYFALLTNMSRTGISFKYLPKQRTATCSTPSYLCSLLQICISSWSLHLVIEWCLVVPSQRGTKSNSRFFVSWKSMFVKWRSKDTEWGFGGESCLLLTSVGQMRMWEVRSDLNDASQWGHTDKHNQGSCVL